MTKPTIARLTPESVLTHWSKEKMDLNKIPKELHALVPLVQRWGGVSSDEEVYHLADVAESDEAYIQELDRWMRSWSDEQFNAYEKWEESISFVDDYEHSKFYFMLGLLDGLEIKAKRAKEDPVAAAIRDLGKMIGESAKAKRRWAAHRLAEMGTEAIAALPTLRQTAQNDPSDEVRAWCFAAIGWIEEKPQAHRQEIELMLAKATTDSRLTIKSALEEINRTDDERALRRLMGACITNDVRTIEKLLKFVDPNQVDQDQATAIDLAVGNSQAEALELLLKAGANPNQLSPTGKEYVLHVAARKRLGPQLVKLLLEYKADPMLKNKDGLTPFDVAKKYNRQKSCELLSAAMK